MNVTVGPTTHRLAALTLILGAIFAGSAALVRSQSGEEESPAALSAQLHADRANALVHAAERTSQAIVAVGAVERFIRPRAIVHGRLLVDPEVIAEAIPFLGSGVVVDGDEGLIVTNLHVVAGLDDLLVTLPDGRQLEAELRGSDPNNDIALLHVDTDEPLPSVELGSSSDLHVGEWALAIGNPFGDLINDPNPTVTAGVISALHRDFRDPRSGQVYLDMIQTDAGINPGNSGGALVNLDGELVGINSAIASRTGGSNGIGFAIPSNLAMEVMNDLITDGRVTRGWLGVGIQDVNSDIAEAMGLENAGGVLITSVLEDGPASSAGLRQGDVIVEYDGKPMKNASELRLAVARTDPGTRVDMVVMRDGRRKTVDVKLAEREEDSVEQVENTAHEDDLGLSVDAITPDLARRLEVQDTEGLVVTAVAPASPAEEAGIQVGDIVRQVNRRDVATPRAYMDAIQNTPQGKPVLFLMERGGNTFFVALRGEG